MSHVVSLREDTIERKLANRYIVIKLTIMVATIVVIIIVFTTNCINCDRFIRSPLTFLTLTTSENIESL